MFGLLFGHSLVFSSVITFLSLSRLQDSAVNDKHLWQETTKTGDFDFGCFMLIAGMRDCKS